MLSVLYFWKSVCSVIFEDRAKIVDFSVLAASVLLSWEGKRCINGDSPTL